MRNSIFQTFPALLILVLAILACYLPAYTQALATTTPTLPIQPLATAVFNAPIPSATFTLVNTATYTPIPTPQNPLVLKATLCWEGPGTAYEVVSSLKKDERVELLGRGSVTGWWVVNNPTYHDPCWMQESDLQIEPGTDLSGLKVFNPPSTPTPTPVPTSTPTPV